MEKKTAVWVHVLAGIGFLLIPMLLAPQPPGISRFELDNPTLRDLSGNILMLAFFYLNYFFLIPKYFLRKQYLPYFGWVFLAFLIIIWLPAFWLGPDPIFDRPPHPRGHGFRHKLGPIRQVSREFEVWDYLASINYQLLLFSVVVLFSILLKLREALFQTEQARSLAEISSLKSQINPHFLFNTLNSIYALSIREQADKTGKSLLKLSGMMRYVITDASLETVSLEQEVGYLENYLELQSLRLPEDFGVSFEKKGNFSGRKIAPLLLIPFVENAFKHGVSPEEPCQIQITVNLEENVLVFEVINQIVSHQLAVHEESGMGIKNTKNRLNLIYGSAHSLELGEKNGYFRVKLKITLD